MTRAGPTQVEIAKRLLAFESADGRVVEPGSTAASRAYDKLHEQLAPLLGHRGVELLFVRSAKLAKGDLAFLADVPLFESAPKLLTRLQQSDPPLAAESAAIFFGNFLALITTLIGERLAAQVLRRAWPTVEIMETKR